ncbi:MAG TPA: endonuclease III domain-containing protein [Thermodesulfobacteriota bacterium]|nr:endonuclease III domain-containing protein [Thermodesulfobacteriota bacterium]
MTKSERIKEFYKVLYEHYGPQGWWPAKTELECILGAILTQSTAWKNVERAVDNLRREGLLSIEKLALVPVQTLASLIRPSGYFNQKAIKIKNFINFIAENFDGSLEKMFEEDGHKLRDKLLKIKGVGPETADSILLYAAKKPIFVVDAYTYRILSRHALIPEEAGYDEIQELFMDSLPEDSQLFNEYHALLVKLAKEHCKKSPVCEGCPLQYDPHTV